MVKVEKFVTFSNGVKMPVVGLGTWQSTPEECKSTVHAALRAGYRLIDTAPIYANEEAIGEVLKEAKGAGIRREDVFVTTKVFSSHLHPALIEESCRDSLKKLKLDYVDLLLAHMPAAFDKNDMTKPLNELTVRDVWKGLENIYEKKLARAIGVSNFSPEQVEIIMHTANVPIHNIQVELNIYLPQHELQEVARKYGISMTSYATIGSPGRSHLSIGNGGVLAWGKAKNLLEDPAVRDLAVKYNKSPAQIAMRYVMERGIAIIPKSTNVKRLVENIQLFDFELEHRDFEILDTIPYHQRLFNFTFMACHREDPFKNERKRAKTANGA